MGVVLMLHSIVRWVIVAVGVIGVVRYALVMAGRMPGNKMDRGLMAGFTGLMDLNMLLGLIYLLWSGLTTPIGFPMERIEHAVTNIIAVVVAHIFASRAKKAADDRVMARNNLLGIVVSLLLVVVAVAVIGGWS
ncbi:hypothetical protein ANRL3_00695 [Anaerolineae bacterium]|nr:hypothetical protein ANRL3_00695 [Anaerolineae bacterium]